MQAYTVTTKRYLVGEGLYIVIAGPEGEIEVDAAVLYHLLKHCGEISGPVVIEGPAARGDLERRLETAIERGDTAEQERLRALLEEPF